MRAERNDNPIDAGDARPDGRSDASAALIMEAVLKGIPLDAIADFIADRAQTARDRSETPGTTDAPDAPRRTSLLALLETFATSGGDERARTATRAAEELIRLSICRAKSEAAATLTEFAQGAVSNESITRERLRALEFTRRACVSTLRLNLYPTRRDSYDDERPPRDDDSTRPHREEQTNQEYDTAPAADLRDPPDRFTPRGARNGQRARPGSQAPLAESTPDLDPPADARTDIESPRDAVHHETDDPSAARPAPTAAPGPGQRSDHARQRRPADHMPAHSTARPTIPTSVPLLASASLKRRPATARPPPGAPSPASPRAESPTAVAALDDGSDSD